MELTHAGGTPFIKFEAEGAPYIAAERCGHCGAVFTETGPRFACPRCATRGAFSPFKAASTGKLHSFSVVKRSYPGVPVPFISAIVDLDDGIVLKGNLLDVPPDAAQIEFGLKVRVVFDEVPGQQSKDGKPFMAYYFKPVAEGAGA